MQKKILSELREVLDGRLPGVEDLPKLRYTAMVFAESMRLYPLTWIFIRIAHKDETLPSGATIPAGAKLYLCQYVMHRNPRYWPNSERFEPERFSESAKKITAQICVYSVRGRRPGLYRGSLRQLGRSLCVGVYRAAVRFEVSTGAGNHTKAPYDFAPQKRNHDEIASTVMAALKVNGISGER